MVTFNFSSCLHGASKLFSWFARHWLAGVIALCVGIVCIAPQIVFITHMGSGYSGIYILKSDAETHYLARMKNSAEGNGIGNPFFREYSHEPSATWSFSEWFLALPSAVVPISVPSLSLIYKFVFPFIATLCAYACFFIITRNYLWSAIGSSAVVIGSALVNTADVMNLLSWSQTYSQFLAYSRPVNPQFSGIIFFIYIVSILYALRQKTRWAFIRVALISTLSWYVYFYTATFILATNCIIALGYTVRFVLRAYPQYVPKRFVSFVYSLLYGIEGVESDSSFNLLLNSPLLETVHKARATMLYALAALVLSIIGGLPFIWATYMLRMSEWYEELARIAHIVTSHAPVMSSSWFITAIIVVFTVVIYRRFHGAHMYPGYTRFFIILLLATQLAINQQVITGIVLQQGHYHWYMNAPLFVLMIWVCIYSLIELISTNSVRTTLFKKVSLYGTALMCCGVVFTYGFLVQSSSYYARKDETAFAQRYASVLDWLKAYTQPGSTVLAHNDISELIPIYTDNNVAWENHATYYLMPHSRREFTPENILQSPAPHDIVKNYPLDYIIQDSAKPFNLPKTFPIHTVTQFGDFTVYTVER